MKKLGEKIWRLREEKGLSQEALLVLAAFLLLAAAVILSKRK